MCIGLGRDFFVNVLAARMAAERQPNEPSDNAHGNGRAVAWYEATTKRHHSRCSFSLQNVQFYRYSTVPAASLDPREEIMETSKAY